MYRQCNKIKLLLHNLINIIHGNKQYYTCNILYQNKSYRLVYIININILLINNILTLISENIKKLP